MYKKISIYSIIITLGVLIIYSCEHKTPNAQLMDEICFETEILPIFQTSCGSCHNAQTPQGGYVFTDYNSILKSVTPGDPEKSIAYQYITEIRHDFMPPEQPLSIRERTATARGRPRPDRPPAPRRREFPRSRAHRSGRPGSPPPRERWPGGTRC